MFKKIFLSFFLLLSVVNAEKSPNFSNWRGQIKLNIEAFESEAHNAFTDIYVNSKALNAYTMRKKLFPVGSVVLKPLFKTAKKEFQTLLMLMKKMPKGYDSKNGDWWYGVYGQSGKQAYYQGKLNSCIACHKQGEKTDYVFSNSVMDHIEKNTPIEPILPDKK